VDEVGDDLFALLEEVIVGTLTVKFFLSAVKTEKVEGTRKKEKALE
jgi:hypothetical protein